ncbi:acetyl-CoA C-acyltransferase [Comamonas humi]
MPLPTTLIAGFARSAVAPHGGAFRQLALHQLAAPVLQGLLARAGARPQDVDAIVLGNALGAGGNPARMVALAAGLPEHCAAYSIDTQCCAGLDAVAMGAALIASGQARVVVAGGAEAWSRAPIRQTRPLHAHEQPQSYERPPFAPRPQDDPDLLLAAARYAAEHGYTREQQDDYARRSHERAMQSQGQLADEIIAIEGLRHDAYPRARQRLGPAQLARMPVVAQSDLHEAPEAQQCATSALAVSTRADGAALVLLASESACAELGLRAVARWHGYRALGGASAMPLTQARAAADSLMQREKLDWTALHAIELHDAFAVQGLQWEQHLEQHGVDAARLNHHGGGLARGHPIGASAAIALVRLLADLQRAGTDAWGLTAVAGAGGLGSAALLQAC